MQWFVVFAIDGLGLELVFYLDILFCQLYVFETNKVSHAAKSVIKLHVAGKMRPYLVHTILHTSIGGY